MKSEWSVAEAKAKFSDLVSRAAKDGPQTITRNGRLAAVVVSPEEWAKIRPEQSLVEFLLDPSWRVLSPEEADTLFERDNGPDRPSPRFE